MEAESALVGDEALGSFAEGTDSPPAAGKLVRPVAEAMRSRAAGERKSKTALPGS